jgi:hypothetical protein
MNVPYVNKRPEQMSVNDFIELTNYLGHYVNFKSLLSKINVKRIKNY